MNDRIFKIDTKTGQFTINSAQYVEYGGNDANGVDYQVTITATGPTWGKRPPAPTQTVTRTNIFTVKVKNPCYIPATIKYTSRLDLPLAVNY